MFIKKSVGDLCDEIIKSKYRSKKRGRNGKWIYDYGEQGQRAVKRLGKGHYQLTRGGHVVEVNKNYDEAPDQDWIVTKNGEEYIDTCITLKEAKDNFFNNRYASHWDEEKGF